MTGAKVDGSAPMWSSQQPASDMLNRHEDSKKTKQLVEDRLGRRRHKEMNRESWRVSAGVRF